MQALKQQVPVNSAGVVAATGETPLFKPGDDVRVLDLQPIGHYRVPNYLRGQRGIVTMVLKQRLLDNEDEGFGRNAGNLFHYYRVSFAMTDLWPNYKDPSRDRLLIEVHEKWLERSEA
jgi:nitrile hydratase